MPIKSTYKSGDHNTIGDISGQEHKRSECVFNWKNQLVHKKDFERKHPQLTLRPHRDSIAVTDGTRTGGEDPALQNPPFTPSDIV